MSKKTKKTKKGAEELPIDKMEHFLERNFRKILMVVGGLLIVFVATYLVIDGMKVRRANQLNELAMLELQLLSQSTALDAEQFIQLAEGSPVGRDYILYMGGVRLAEAGRTEEAIDLLSRVGGDFVELRDSLMYDLENNTDVKPAAYGKGSKLDAVWDYREVLAAKPEAAKTLAESYIERFPENRLTDLVKNWEK